MRPIEWKTKRENGTVYNVRVRYFGAKYRFQFQEKGEPNWDYEREPERADLEKLVELIRNKRNRGQVGPKELANAERLLM